MFQVLIATRMENRHKETNLLCMNFTKVEQVFVGSTWKRYKYFPIDGANASGVKKWRLPSVRSKYSNNRKLRLIFVNVCKHSYNKYSLPWQPACMQRYTKSSFFYATCRSAISWEVPVLNQCTSDKNMLIFSYISLVSLCLFSMV